MIAVILTNEFKIMNHFVNHTIRLFDGNIYTPIHFFYSVKIDSFEFLFLSNIKIGLNNGIIQIQNPYTKEIKKENKGHTSGITCLVLLSNGYLASGSNDSTIIIWDLEVGAILWRL